MNDSCFFSIIIPTLNEEKYLPTISESLSRQTFKDFELILVDGRSKDQTIKIFKKFKDLLPSADLIISDKANVGYQRNLGAKKAKGEYLVFLDADCDVGETFLEELHVAAVKQKFPFATTWIKPDSEKPIDNLMLFLANLGQELAKVVNKQYTGGYNTIVKKEVFEKLKGFREDLKISEDHDFALRAQKKDIEVTILKEPQVIFSLRRYRSEGILPVLRKVTEGQIYYFLQNPISSAFFEYPMGGHVHQIRKKKKINLVKINAYIKAIKKLENKIVDLLKD